jgi:hypothetical protein
MNVCWKIILLTSKKEMSHEIDQDGNGIKKNSQFLPVSNIIRNPCTIMPLKQLSQNLLFLYFLCAPFTKISNTLAKNYKKIDIRIG